MAGKLIPTVSYPAYTMRVRLDGLDYRLRLRWHTREQRWRLDLYDAEEEPLVLGLAIEANRPLLRWYHSDDRVPPGELFAVSTIDDDSPPGLEELGAGKRCELTYYPVET